MHIAKPVSVELRCHATVLIDICICLLLSCQLLVVTCIHGVHKYMSLVGRKPVLSFGFPTRLDATTSNKASKNQENLNIEIKAIILSRLQKYKINTFFVPSMDHYSMKCIQISTIYEDVLHVPHWYQNAEHVHT